MGYVLDLAIELPVYQRKVLYAYNADVIDASSLPETINPYTSPLDKLWEIKLTDEASAGGSNGLSSGAVVGILIGCFFGGWMIAIAILFATKKLTMAKIYKLLGREVYEDMGPLNYDDNVLLEEDGEYIILEEEIYVEEDVIVDIDDESTPTEGNNDENK